MKSVSRLFVVVALCLVGLLSTHTDVAVAKNVGEPEVCSMSPEVSGLLSGVKIYPYECEYIKKSGSDYYYCFTPDTFSLNTDYYCTVGMTVGAYKQDYSPMLQFKISAGDKTFASLCNRSARCEGEQMEVDVVLTMSDGERFNVRGYLMDVRKEEFNTLESLGIGVLYVHFNVFTSNRKSLTGMSDRDRIRYVSQKLRTYNIDRINFEGFSLELKKFPTQFTLGLMFDTLEKKTGRNYFRYSVGSGNTGGSVSATTQAKATISSITGEYDVWQYGKKGVNVVITFTVSGMRGKTGLAATYYYFRSGDKLKDFNGAYRATDGQVSASTKFTPLYDSTKYTNLKIFIPYDELHLSSGRSELKVNVNIFDENNRCIGISDWLYFWCSV